VDLHNGMLFWDKTEDNDIHINRKDIADHYDVVIVGGGMSGSLCAYTLANEGLKIAVIDKGKIGGGSTLANTGLLQFSNDIMLHELSDQIGTDKAVRFYKLCREAVDQLEEVSKKLPSSSDFIRRKSFYFASDEDDISKLKHEYDALIKYGFEAEYLTRQEIEEHFPFSKPAGIITHGDAEVNPFQFSRGIIRYLNELDCVDIFEHVTVEDLKENKNGIEVQTSSGIFHADHILYATGYEKPPFLSETRADLNRSYAIATEPIDDLSAWEDRDLIWETKRPYLYLRTTQDRRIVAGGLDVDKPETPQSEEWINNRAERIRNEVEKLFPMLNIKVAYAWGAAFGESVDNLPFIGKHPSKDRIYYLLGYGGNGTVYSMLGSVILRDLIIGRPNDDAEIVKLDR
jgi:glycine/D-amino acid oxidase-like deaminating enzyme